jgi:hypothetical protein
MYKYSNKRDMTNKFPVHLRDVHTPENTMKRSQLAANAVECTRDKKMVRTGAGSLLWNDDDGTVSALACARTGATALNGIYGIDGTEGVDEMGYNFNEIFGD